MMASRPEQGPPPRPGSGCTGDSTWPATTSASSPTPTSSEKSFSPTSPCSWTSGPSGACHAACSPTIHELAEEYSGKVKSEGGYGPNRDVSVKFGISAIPTIILFKNGEVQKKFVGLTRKEDFKAALDSAMH